MNESLEISIDKVIAEKRGKPLPRPLVRLLQRIIHEQEINHILRTYGHLEGVDFLSALIQEFAVDVQWVYPERLPQSGRCIFACNHPLGGMDGISIAYLLSQKYGAVKYLVNDMLYNLKPLRPVFLPLNKSGAQGREAIELLKAAMATDVPIGTFPAGFCSRIYHGKIQDQPWRKTFISQAITHERDVVPLHFVGQNSAHFYWIWRIKQALGLKFDPGSALLPDELFRTRGRSYRVLVGDPIPWQELRDSPLRPDELASEVRVLCYELHTTYDQKITSDGR